MGVVILHQETRRKQPKYMTIQTLTGTNTRKFYEIEIVRSERTANGWVELPTEKVWADWHTGTLYNQSGKCLSSTQLRIIDGLRNSDA